MKLAVWSPLPPSPSGIADYVAESLPYLATKTDLTVVVEQAEAGMSADGPYRVCAADTAPEVDLDLYHVGNSPAHGYIYQAARRRPGVAILHEWNLHHLVLRETLEHGDREAYLREMRRAYGETGTFVGSQVARALGGTMFPALYPLNERILDGSLAIVGLTRFVCERVAARHPTLPLLHLRHHLGLPMADPPSRAEARAHLGWPLDAPVIVAPGLATNHKRLHSTVRAMRSVKSQFPGLRLIIAGEVEAGVAFPSERDDVHVTGRLSLSEFVWHLAAADIVVALRFPSYGEMSGAVVRALGLGRAVIVTAGTPLAEEFPPGVVATIDPGSYEDVEYRALLAALLSQPELRERMGGLASEYVHRRHDLSTTTSALLDFVDQVYGRRQELQDDVARRRTPETGLLAYLLDEVRYAAQSLRLTGLPADIIGMVAPLARHS